VSAASSDAPSAVATATVSWTAPSSAERQRGSVRTNPIGRFAALVVRASGHSRASLDHMIWRSPAPTQASIPAARSSAANSSTAGASRGSEAARSTRHDGLVCTITPVRGRSDSIRITPAATRSAPNRARSSSRWSSPLSSGTTSCGTARTRCIASAKPVAFVATNRKCTSSSSSGTARGRAVNSPSTALRTTSPRSAIATAVAGRATTVTSSPARARAPATKPPTPPAPSTATEVIAWRRARGGEPGA
jgi:hypothetical protein